MAQTVKRLPTMWETRVWIRGQEDPLKKEMATHSNTLAWKIPWTEEPVRLQSMGLQQNLNICWVDSKQQKPIPSQINRPEVQNQVPESAELILSGHSEANLSRASLLASCGRLDIPGLTAALLQTCLHHHVAFSLSTCLYMAFIEGHQSLDLGHMTSS